MKVSKALIVAIASGVVLIAVSMYWLNGNLFRYFSAFPQVQLSMSAPSVVQLNSGNEFTVNVHISGQKVLTTDLVLAYDPNKIAFYKEYTSRSGVTNTDAQGAAYFQNPLAEQVATSSTGAIKGVRAVLVSQYRNQNPDWTTDAVVSFKFRALATGTTAIWIHPMSRFGGLSSGAPVLFDMPAQTISTSITVTN